MESEQLRAYVVWLPMLAQDTEQQAAEAAASLVDGRGAHFWNADAGIARSASRALGIHSQLEAAWDVFLIYATDATWTEGEMPEPTAWMHRLTTQDDPRWMSGERLERVIRALLPTPAAKP